MSHWKAWLKRLFDTATTPPVDRYASTFGILVAGTAFIVFALAFFSALISLWPAVASAGANLGNKQAVTLGWGLYTLHVGKTTGLLVLALLMGAIGGYIHAATSFVSYIGNRQFKASWGWWYALRALIGASLALLIYVALRAGFLSTGASTAAIDPYGVAAVSGMAGLFSKQATDKLEEIFNTAFRTGPGVGDQQRGDAIAAVAPTIAAVAPSIETLTPSSVQAGQASSIVIKGSGFLDGAVVRVDGQPVADATWQDPTKITFQLPAERFAQACTARVAVMNPNEACSPAATLTIT